MINQKSNAQEYMEDEYNIVLPEMKDQDFQLGDLWDCRKSARVDFNLFLNSFSSLTDLVLYKHFKVAPIMNNRENSGNRFKNINDQLNTFEADGIIKLEALAGLINVNGLSDYFDQVKKRNFIEAIYFNYHLELFAMTLNPNAGKLINDKVKKRLLNNQIVATHFVSKIVTGAFIDASIATIDRQNMRNVVYVNSKP
jgi:hypothetical protein